MSSLISDPKMPESPVIHPVKKRLREVEIPISIPPKKAGR